MIIFFQMTRIKRPIKKFNDGIKLKLNVFLSLFKNLIINIYVGIVKNISSKA